MNYLKMVPVLLLLGCGKTRTDYAYKATTRFENHLATDIRLVMYGAGIIGYDTIIAPQSYFAIVEDGLEGPGPGFFFNFDSARIYAAGISKSDSNYMKYGKGFGSDTINIFNRERYLVESSGERSSVYRYIIGGLDSAEMK
jgi:hypothetical protein